MALDSCILYVYKMSGHCKMLWVRSCVQPFAATVARLSSDYGSDTGPKPQIQVSGKLVICNDAIIVDLKHHSLHSPFTLYVKIKGQWFCT